MKPKKEHEHCDKCDKRSPETRHPNDIEKEALSRLAVLDHFRGTKESEPVAIILGKHRLRTILVRMGGSASACGRIYFITCRDILLSSLHAESNRRPSYGRFGTYPESPKVREYHASAHAYSVGGRYTRAVKLIKNYIRHVER